MVRDFANTTIWFPTLYGYPLTFIFKTLPLLYTNVSALYDAVSKWHNHIYI